MGRELEYAEVLNIYQSGSTIYYDTDYKTVNYVVPVSPDCTYTVVMTEIGNRLRVAFTTSNPIITAADMPCTSIVENPTYSAGYTLRYKPTTPGYLVVYVSNAGEHPVISISEEDDGYAFVSVEANSVKTLTASIDTKAGDWVLCTVTTRSTTTFPEDWEILHTSQVLNNSSQRMSMLCKKIDETGTISLSVSQSNSDRIYITLIAFHNIGGFRYYEGSELFYNSDSYSRFEVAHPGHDRIVWAMTSPLWAPSSPFSPWACSDISSLVLSVPQTVQRRQANFVDSDDGTTRTFIPGGTTNTSAIIDYVEVIPASYYPSGSAEFSITAVRDMATLCQGKLAWDEDKPDGTDISVYAKLSVGDYEVCENGGDIPCIVRGRDYSNETLFVKVELSTIVQNETPKVSNLTLQMYNEGDDHIIVLEMGTGNTTNIQNAIGEVLVEYAGGTLIGEGGMVPNFSIAFLPENLIYEGHQHDIEHIDMGIDVDTELVRVYHRDRNGPEHIDVSIEVASSLIHVDDI